MRHGVPPWEMDQQDLQHAGAGLFVRGHLRRKAAGCLRPGDERIVPRVNVVGYAAAQAAHEKGAEWRRALLAHLRHDRDLVEQSIALRGQAGYDRPTGDTG